MFALVRSKGLRAAITGARQASTVGATLDEAVARLPHKEALRSIKQDVRWSFKELNAVVDELANGFLDLQFQQGNVVALWLPNSAENVATQLAAAKAGLTLAVIEPEVSKAEELAFILQDCQASGLIFEPKQAGRDQTAIVRGLFPELATCKKPY
jgi:fatty-acyl-CoA synthase